MIKKKSQNEQLTLVGIGSSAGGLQALTEFFKHCAALNNFSYVVVQHTSPNYQTMLPKLLKDTTKLRVKEAEHLEVIEEGVVYIAPSNKDIMLRGDCFELTPSENTIGPRPSVDGFFSSLSKTESFEAIGIVLSGTGNDGTQGLKELKNAGFLTISQSPDSAKYDGMPRSAISSGFTDIVLSPSELGEQLADILDNFRGLAQRSVSLERKDHSYNLVLKILKKQVQVDFSHYKEPTIRRRIQRRMLANKILTLDDYATFLTNNPSEVHTLFQDVLISVTEMFRDQVQFEELETELEDYLKRKDDGDTIRIWCAGCSSGEEAYSLAITVNEVLKKQNKNIRMTVFATDINEATMEAARKGVYSERSLESVKQSIKNEYFTKLDGHYQINKHIREMVVFARHDLTSDPPFLRVDLISCRNVFIYFGPAIQERITKIFHYSLNPKGILFLGKAEATSSIKDYFQPSQSHSRVYRKLPKKSDGTISFGTLKIDHQPKFITSKTGKRDSLKVIKPYIKSIAPTSLLLDSDFTLLQIFGSAQEYISLSEGAASLKLDDLILEPYKKRLMPALLKSRRLKQNANKVCISSQQDPKKVFIDIFYIEDPIEPQIIVSFSEKVEEVDESTTPPDSDFDSYSEMRELQQELLHTREQLNLVVEEQETSNEELQALNEEMQSANEELQSTNEELEVSNEELQSTNEELTTLNEELNSKSNELVLVNRKLNNVIETIDDPVIVVDSSLRLSSFNRSAEKMFDLKRDPTKNSELAVAFLKYSSGVNLVNLASKCLRSKSVETMTVNIEQRVFFAKAQPILGNQNEVEGVVFSLNDNTDLENALSRLQGSERQLKEIFEHSPASVSVKDLTGKYTYANSNFLKLHGKKEEEVIGRDDYQLFSFEEAARVKDIEIEALRSKRAMMREETYKVGERTENFYSYRFRLLDKDGKPYGLCVMSFTVTELVSTKHELQLFRDIVSSSKSCSLIFFENAEETERRGHPYFLTNYVSDNIEQMLGVPARNFVNKDFFNFFSHIVGRRKDQKILRLIKSIKNEGLEWVEIKGMDGEDGPRWYELRSSFVPGRKGKPDGFHLILNDITEKKLEERNQKQHQAEILKSARLASLGEMAAGISHELNTPLQTIQSSAELLELSAQAGEDVKEQALFMSEKIIDTVGKISGIIKSLRSLAKMDETLTSETVEVRKLLLQVKEATAYYFKNAGIELRFECSEDVSIVCRPRQIEQVVINLLTNAVDAVKKQEEKWVKLQLLNQDKTIKILVEDNGPGVPDSLKSQIMTPFFTTKKEGTGLGLSLTSSIVEEHRGYMRIDCSGGTTIFEIELPKECDEL
ncbi:MAG: hypothetical protein CME64_03190 [Halobacteriovoraceae bacterium]|nr:hypothetical protein [Halobacteriovoraceae bacterium]|tara:strand:- start:5300 stop:9289 length:3990 start_codon:yes stop_codon:yes gene_type:complete